MGFKDAADLVLGGIGEIQQADAAGDEEKRQKAAQAKAVADASALVAKQKSDLDYSRQLGTAFNSLSTYQARSAGAGSTQFTGKLGLSGGGNY